jgi:gluconate kinase
VEFVSARGKRALPTLLIRGPGGVGKTTVAFEISRQLEAAGVGHALLDMDELDRIYPAPQDDPHKTHLTRRNLAAVWANLREAGAARLILTMVAVSPDYELPHIREAVPEASITMVRLHASEEILLERLCRREIGSGREHQIRRTIEQMNLMAGESPDGSLAVDTSGRPVADVAREILQRTGWPD